MVQWHRPLVWRVLLLVLSLTLLAASRYTMLQAFVARSSSSSSSSTHERVVRLARQLHDAIAHVDGDRVMAILDGSSSSKNNNGSRRVRHLSEYNFTGDVHSRPLQALLAQHTPRVLSPYDYLTDMVEDVSGEAYHVMHYIFHYFSAINGDGSVQHHPLTNAYRKQRYAVAARLLEHWPFDRAAAGAVVPEVYAAALTCDDIAHVDARVTLVTVGDDDTDNNDNNNDGDAVRDDTRACVREHARRVPYARSRLRQVYMQHRANDRRDEANSSAAVERDVHAQHALQVSMLRAQQQQHAQSTTRLRRRTRVVAPPSTVRSGMWLHALRKPSPPPYLLPPHGELIMHPGVFVDMADALWYYVTGTPMEHVRWQRHVNVVLLLSLWCLVLLVLAARQSLRARRAAAAAAEAAQAPHVEHEHDDIHEEANNNDEEDGGDDAAVPRTAAVD